MTLLHGLMIAWGIILVIDFFRNRKKKQVEIWLLSYDAIWIAVPFIFAYNVFSTPVTQIIAFIAMAIVVYITKAKIMGTRINCSFASDDELVRSLRNILKSETVSVKKDMVHQMSLKDGNFIFVNNSVVTIKNSLNILTQYKLRKKIAEGLKQKDERINNAFVYLIIGLVCIALGVYRTLV